MTQDVLSHGSHGDERRGSPGRAVGVAVVVALVALAGVTARRSASERGDPPPPSATPSSPGPGALPGGPRPSPPAGGEPFASFVTVRRPPPGVLRTALLPDGVPGFLLPSPDGDLPTAVAAIGGPDHAPVLVGWCAESETFQDADGRVFYDAGGSALAGGASLPRHAVRRNARDALRLDVDAAGRQVTSPAAAVQQPPRCRRPLYLPALPRRGATVHDTVTGHRVLRGRYVVTTETRAFCTSPGNLSCASDGWEQYGAGLPPGDLAESYTWEGEYVVRGFAGGDLRAVRLPGTRLVARRQVGAEVRVGQAHLVHRRGDGPYRIVFNPMRHVSGTPDDDSPGQMPPHAQPELAHLMTDIVGTTREYVARPDVAVFLGPGVTGLGIGRGTVRTLERFLGDPDNARRAFWLVLDGRGRVLRVVIDPTRPR